MLARGVEAAVLPTAMRYGMGVLTWGPLSAGWLSGRYTHSVDLSSGGRTTLERQKFDPAQPENARKLQAVGALAQLAEQAGLSLPHLAVGFVLVHPAVTSVIIGPRTLGHLDDCWREQTPCSTMTFSTVSTRSCLRARTSTRQTVTMSPLRSQIRHFDAAEVHGWRFSIRWGPYAARCRQRRRPPAADDGRNRLATTRAVGRPRAGAPYRQRPGVDGDRRRNKTGRRSSHPGTSSGGPGTFAGVVRHDPRPDAPCPLVRRSRV